jgi:antitoxin component HigA of HigAB toxin-antitoxin module
MKPKIIRSEADHEAALERIAKLMEDDPEPATPWGRNWNC